MVREVEKSSVVGGSGKWRRREETEPLGLTVLASTFGEKLLRARPYTDISKRACALRFPVNP